MSKNKVEDELDTLIIYNDEQRFYVNILENAKILIKQMEDSIKFQKDVIEMADAKIEALATPETKV